MYLNQNPNYNECQILREQMFTSLLFFIKIFFELKEGKPFVTPPLISRPSHYAEVCQELQAVFDLKTNRLVINIPPGLAKSTIVIYFICWCMAQYPDCNFIYVSYGYELAESHTATIKEIMSLPLYKKLFNVHIKRDKSSKGDFETTAGGRIKAFGSTGPITGMNAGLPYVKRFSGAVIMDDMHKPREAASKTSRTSVINNYNSTIRKRPRSDLVPQIFIGQRLHREDLAGYLLSGQDGNKWKSFIRKGLDDSGNALCPSIRSAETLRIEQKHSRYEFAAQEQQDPVPAGGALYLQDDFVLLSQEPKIIKTFITCDTAETSKTYNDQTVFSFWGLFEIIHKSVETGDYGLFLLNCWQEWYEPKDLEDAFYKFWADCMRHRVKPEFAAIEKKNTGVTLLSALSAVPGLKTLEIERTKASGSKADRYIEMQKFISKKLIALPAYMSHSKLFIEHMIEITANDTHAHDDICDTAYDAVKLALIDKIIFAKEEDKDVSANLVKLNAGFNRNKMNYQNTRRI